MEDRPLTVEGLVTLCRDKGYSIKMVSTIHRFLDLLEENKDRIRLIILDLLLYGISSLESVQITDSDTDGGFNAGWIIIERLLHPKGCVGPYSHIPVVILSTRPATAKDFTRLELLNRDGLQVHYFEKDGAQSLDLGNYIIDLGRQCS
jgi:CheY-like chemotaxis protein